MTTSPNAGARSPEELHEDLTVLRTEIGETVEELAHRVDVPARARAKKDEAVVEVRRQVGRARELIAEKTPVVRRALEDNPVVAGGGALALVLLLVRALRGRKASAR